jgi:hypothetical protein
MPAASDADFAARAQRLAGQAALAFGWTPDIFWGSTPADLAAVVAACGEAAAGGATAPPSPAARAALLEMFPDG